MLYQILIFTDKPEDIISRCLGNIRKKMIRIKGVYYDKIYTSDLTVVVLIVESEDSIIQKMNKSLMNFINVMRSIVVPYGKFSAIGITQSPISTNQTFKIITKSNIDYYGVLQKIPMNYDAFIQQIIIPFGPRSLMEKQLPPKE